MTTINGKQSLIPMFFDDESCILCDSMAGGANSTLDMPNELTLQYERPGKKTLRGRFKLIQSSLYEHQPYIPEPEPIEKPPLNPPHTGEKEKKDGYRCKRTS